MSIMRCFRHDLDYDSDFREECPACENEPREEHSMTKEDFEATAKILREFPYGNYFDNRSAAYEFKANFTSRVADELEKTNPRFNRSKFIAACFQATE